MRACRHPDENVTDLARPNSLRYCFGIPMMNLQGYTSSSQSLEIIRIITENCFEYCSVTLTMYNFISSFHAVSPVYWEEVW